MREYRKAISEASKRKLDSIEKGEPHTKVDSSSWSPPPMLEADKQNGMRPVSPRQYKSGGKVHGEHAKKRADRKARKEGGRTMSIDGFINRDDKMANEERKGVKKIGGMKRGGAAEHTDEAQDKKLMHKVLKPKAFKADGGAMHHKDCSCKMCSGGRTKHADGGEAGRGLYVREGYPHEVPGANGGRTARKHGGATKGKTHINIMVNPHGAHGGVPPAAPPMGGPMMPPPPHPPMPSMPPMGGAPMGGPPMGGPPMGMPMGAPPAMPPMGAGRPGMPPIGRKHGGKIPSGMHTKHIIDNAAGGGLGRLEKIKAYGLD
jgi:hypothetical protein